MPVLSDIQSDVANIVSQRFSVVQAQVVPENDNIALNGGAKSLTATMFYADLAESTKIAMFDRQMAAKLFKCFLAASARIVRAEGGEIRSFDGDRLMAVFMGGTKNTDAVRAALKLKYAFDTAIATKFKATYLVFRNGTYPLGYTCGIDTSEVLVVRGGIRNNNDLVWVGRAPNVAAKLSGIREADFRTYITKAVFDAMLNEVKFGGNPQRSMWESRTWTQGPVSSIYRSNWHRIDA